jgi:hypothetical protein
VLRGRLVVVDVADVVIVLAPDPPPPPPDPEPDAEPIPDTWEVGIETGGTDVGGTETGGTVAAGAVVPVVLQSAAAGVGLTMMVPLTEGTEMG